MCIIYWMSELASSLHLFKLSPYICQVCLSNCKAPFGICEDPIQKLSQHLSLFSLALLLVQLVLDDLCCPEMKVVSLELGSLHWQSVADKCDSCVQVILGCVES